ncbi:unnamed protein product, partial [Allacma fusca]
VLACLKVTTVKNKRCEIRQWNLTAGVSIRQNNFSTVPVLDPNIVKSTVPDTASVKNVTLPELFRSQSNVLPGSRTAFECAVTGLKYSRDEVLRYGRSFGAALLQAGLKRGDIVAILLPNCPQYSVVVMGLLDTGIIGSQINPAYTPPEITSLVAQSEAKAIITLTVFVPLAQHIQGLSKGSIKNIIVVGETTEGCHSFNEMIKTDPMGAEFLEGSKIDTSNETAMILWSSGTTGPPKGAMITHENIATSVLSLAQKEISDFRYGEERLFGLIPMFHIYGSIAMLYCSLYGGATVTTLPKFDPALFTQALKATKPTFLHLVPPLVSFIVANPAITKEDLAATHTLVCGAAAAGPVVINRLLEKAGDQIFFQEGFGMTESSGLSHIILRETHNSRIGSIGHPVSNTMSKIICVETGKTLGPGENGEICVKGPHVMKGYLNNDEATKNTIDEDEEGLFYVVDRLKELIKVKGLQVAPSELEDVLRTHDNVADVAVIGIPDERSGELPRAYIVSKGQVTDKEIQAFLKGRVAEHKQLDGGVEFVESIPKSASGKILRREIMQMYKNKAN